MKNCEISNNHFKIIIKNSQIETKTYNNNNNNLS